MRSRADLLLRINMSVYIYVHIYISLRRHRKGFAEISSVNNLYCMLVFDTGPAYE